MSARPSPQLSKHDLGDVVRFGNTLDLAGVIEEIIWCRNMAAPFYLVEYWHEGHLCRARIHEEDCR